MSWNPVATVAKAARSFANRFFTTRPMSTCSTISGATQQSQSQGTPTQNNWVLSLPRDQHDDAFAYLHARCDGAGTYHSRADYEKWRSDRTISPSHHVAISMLEVMVINLEKMALADPRIQEHLQANIEKEKKRQVNSASSDEDDYYDRMSRELAAKT